MSKKKIVVITGAGISAESGIDTYRDKGGLWEKFDPQVMANIRTWQDPNKKHMMNDFYNERRKELADVEPNTAHIDLTQLEDKYDVTIITQNVDCLHEKAGSSNILHLHGELTKVRFGDNMRTIEDIGYEPLDINVRKNYRPHIVFFGESVPNMTKAEKIVNEADKIVVIGTSLQVYPAASLVENYDGPVYVVDPEKVEANIFNVTHIKEKATKGMNKLLDILL